MSGSPIQLQLITTTEGFHQLEPQWNPLLRATGNNSVFLTFEYLSTWWDAYAAGLKLRIVAAWEANRLIGLAPLTIGPGPNLARRWFRHLALMGSHGDELSESLDFLIAPGRHDELAGRFLEFVTEELRNEWDAFYLNLVPSGSGHLASLLPLAIEKGLPGRTLETIPSPYLPLPVSWQELIRSKSKNFRKQFNNHWNRLHKQHRVEILQAGRDLAIDEAFAVLLRLNRRRWGKQGQAFTTPKTRRFHCKLAHRFHDLGWLCFLLMKVDGEFAAARFDYVYDGKLWNIQGGWNPEFARLSPGRMLLGAQMQWCIRQGLREYDFLAGEADYKWSWTTLERRLINVEFLRPDSPQARMFQGLRALKNRLKQAGAPASETASVLPAGLA